MRRATRAKLLIVEDDPDLQRQLRWGFDDLELIQVGNRDDAMTALRLHEPAVGLLDLGLPPEPGGVGEGFATLEGILALLPATRVIILTGQDDRAHAVRAVAMGAHDFCTKPLQLELLTTLVARAFHLAALASEGGRRGLPAAEAALLPGVIGVSAAMQHVAGVVARVAAAPVSVILRGESGTGKELVARALHALGPRRQQPFVAIDCAAIPSPLLEAELFGYEHGGFTGAVRQMPGKVEGAHGGTLFLDEIGELPLPLQVKLLRLLRERVLERSGGRPEIHVDVRIVAATRHDLQAAMRQGRFREDLYYRLSEVTIPIPPLRERPGDAVLLAHHLVASYGSELGRGRLGLTDEAIAAIDAHAWRGNVRELQNRVKRAVLLAAGRRIEAADLELEPPTGPAEPINLRAAREQAELSAVRRAIAQSRGNVSKAARLLGISRPTLYDLLRQHNLRAH